MALCQLLYVSQATRPFSEPEIDALLARARDHNARTDITGLLLYSAGHFMQLLEGDDLCVSTLFGRIQKDPRHHSVEELLRNPAEARLFPQWRMGLLNLDVTAGDLDRERLRLLLLKIRIHAAAQRPTDALALLKDFREQLPAAA